MDQTSLHTGGTLAGGYDISRADARPLLLSTPGVGFGPSGEGYLRLTAFGSREHTEEAVERIRTRLGL